MPRASGTQRSTCTKSGMQRRSRTRTSHGGPENSKCAYQEAFRDLDRALKDFVKSRKGERKGKRLGFPRRKRKGRCRDSFRLTGIIRCAGNTVTLPRLGTIRTHESTDKLASKLEDGSARILSATVTQTAQRRPAGRRGPLVPVVQDLLGVRTAKAKPDARRADLPLRDLRPHGRPGRERGP